MFEKETVINVDGLDVRVARRPGTATFDVTLPDGLGGAGGFTLTYFPEGALSEEGALREEIANYIASLTPDA